MTYKKQELLFGICLLLSGASMMWHSFNASYADLAQDIAVGPMFFPRILLVVWLICALGIIIEAIRLPSLNRKFDWPKVLLAVLVLGLFAFLFNKLGFILTGIACFISLSLLLGYKKIKLLLVISVAYVIFIELVFRTVLQMYLPTFSLFGV